MRKVQEFGLMADYYVVGSDIRKAVKRISALSFLL